MANDNDLEELVKRVHEGDMLAFEAWHAVERKTVYRICFGFLANAAEAEDLTQDALIKLHDKIAAAALTRSYPAWRTTIVANLCRDRLRRIQVRVKAEHNAGELQPRHETRDAHNKLDRQELRELLRTSLALLPTREREAFVLRDLEQHSTKETAQILGVNDASVRSLLSLARRRLRNHLGPILSPGSRWGARNAKRGSK